MGCGTFRKLMKELVELYRVIASNQSWIVHSMMVIGVETSENLHSANILKCHNNGQISKPRSKIFHNRFIPIFYFEVFDIPLNVFIYIFRHIIISYQI